MWAMGLMTKLHPKAGTVIYSAQDIQKHVWVFIACGLHLLKLPCEFYTCCQMCGKISSLPVLRSYGVHHTCSIYPLPLQSYPFESFLTHSAGDSSILPIPYCSVPHQDFPLSKELWLVSTWITLLPTLFVSTFFSFSISLVSFLQRSS